MNGSGDTPALAEPAAETAGQEMQVNARLKGTIQEANPHIPATVT